MRGCRVSRSPEVLALLYRLPTFYMDRRLTVIPWPFAVDASGNAMGITRARAFAEKGMALGSPLVSAGIHLEQKGVVVLEHFASVGGAYEACLLLEVHVPFAVHIEISKGLARLVDVSSSGCPYVRDITLIGYADAVVWRDVCPRVEAVVSIGGSPCQGLSAPQYEGQWLSRELSWLVFVLIRF